MVDKTTNEYKQSRCIHVLTKGKAKGECCDNKRMEGSDYCKSHTKLKKLTSGPTGETSEEKVELI
jgi:hypothetical protein